MTSRLSFVLCAVFAIAGCDSKTPTHKPSEAECKAIAANFGEVGGLPSQVTDDFAKECTTAEEDKWEGLHCIGRAKSRADLERCADAVALKRSGGAAPSPQP